MFSLHEDVLSDVENVLVDGGYSGDPFANNVEKLLHCKVEVAKRSELHTFKIIPKRWVVERSFAWLEKCRRLWKNCERKLNTSLHMVIVTFAVLVVKDYKLQSPQRTQRGFLLIIWFLKYLKDRKLIL